MPMQGAGHAGQAPAAQARHRPVPVPARLPDRERDHLVRQLSITDEPAHRALHECPGPAVSGCPMCSGVIEPDAFTLDGMHPDCALTPDTVALSCVLADRARAAR